MTISLAQYRENSPLRHKWVLSPAPPKTIVSANRSIPHGRLLESNPVRTKENVSLEDNQCEGFIDARVLRLINWRERQRKREVSAWHWALSTCAFAALCLLATDYYQLLIKMHYAAEWLVR
jgi:hypothetical protein